MAGFLGGIFGSDNKAGADAAAQSNQMLQKGRDQALAELWGGEGRALGQYGTNYYDPYTKTGGDANTMYANALGLNGAGGNTAATGAFQAGPGYQFQLDQGIQALDRSAAGKGLYGSGNNAMALTQYGQGLANQEYGNWLSRLSGLGAQGLTAAAGQTGRQGALAGINQWGAGGRAAGDLSAATASAANFMNGATSDAASNAQSGANLFSALLGGANLGAKLSGIGGFAPSLSGK